MAIIYIAGKVTGLPLEEVIAKFKKKENELLAQGHLVMNPVEMYQEHLNDCKKIGVPPASSWNDIMRMLLRDMLLVAEEVHALPCWSDSRGACLEIHLASELGMKVVMPLKKGGNA